MMERMEFKAASTPRAWAFMVSVWLICAGMVAGGVLFCAAEAWAQETPGTASLEEAAADLKSAPDDEVAVARVGVATKAAEPAKLRVGVAGSPPFVVTKPATAASDGDDSARVDGISVEIWRRIAAAEGWDYTLRAYGESVPNALEGLERGEVDILVGPTSITSSRAKRVKFSQPYFQAGLSILSNSAAPGVWQRVKPLFSRQLLYGIGVLLLILGVVGTLIWLAERHESPEQFPMSPPHGIANGMWCAIVTMSTTGYGDLAPVTFWGRLVAASWMIISLLFATTMVAGIASTLTLSGMQNVVVAQASDLRGRRVAVPPNSPAAAFVREHGGQIIPIDRLGQGYDFLKDGKADAVVFDRPQMLYALQQQPDADVAVSDGEYIKQGYGFAFALDSDLVQTVDVHMLRLKENEHLQRVVRQWLGAQAR